MHEDKLEKHISEEHFKQLSEGVSHWSSKTFQMRFNSSSMILEWLGLGSVGNMIPRESSESLNWRADARKKKLEYSESSDSMNWRADARKKKLEYLESSESMNWRADARKRQDTQVTDGTYLNVSNRILDVDYQQGVMEKYDEIKPDTDGVALTIEQVNNQIKKGDEREVCVFGADEMRARSKWMTAELRKSDIDMEESDASDIWQLSITDRWKLYRCWVHGYRSGIEEEIKNIEQRFQLEQERLVELKHLKDSEIMEQADVIGMTTTGSARYWHVLQQILPKVIIVEEAAEVLESHIVTALSPGCEHLILIGDHKQLMPSPAVYELAKRYNLDLSLFERMVNNGMQCNTLVTQHRMRPEIAAIVEPIYPDLKNHESVMKYEQIKGVKKNIYFITHTEEETLHQDNQSRSNEHEAQYTAALCKYFLLQGYSPKQITVLTTYSGQLFALRKWMSASELNEVSICVVDNYQGEENDIILLSLVRSNKENSIGFLKIENRVCVALSRAKKGFFIIGNLTLLSNQYDLWSEILQILRKQNCVGRYLELYCNNHPDKMFRARTADDFKQAPEGGCLQPCEFRLNCGHVCARKCHVTDLQHDEYQCPKPCLGIHCEKNHVCPRKCYERCDWCIVEVHKEDPNCHHINSVPCWFNFERSNMPFLRGYEYKCKQPCEKVCNTGHPCPKQCWENCECQVLVLKNCPKCDFGKMVPCCFDFKRKSFGKDENYFKYKCERPCNKQLCDQLFHLCPKLCWEDCDDKCSYMVEKENPFCHHKYEVPCSFQFSRHPWNTCFYSYKNRNHEYNKCQVLVEKENPICHHVYKLPCFKYSNITLDSEKYQRCQQPCNRICENNHKCHKKCYEDSSFKSYICGELCERMLDCGHCCAELCGSSCTKECRVQVKKKLPCGHLMNAECYLSEWKLQCQKPCEKMLKCGHRCVNLCSNTCTAQCKVIISKELPCGHKANIDCHASPASITCEEQCERKLECGHDCVEICGGPCTAQCKVITWKELPCGHKANIECHVSPASITCEEQCERKSECGHDCVEICGGPCTAQCKVITWKELPCGHKANIQCHVSPASITCEEQCERKLECGHDCVEICGGPCTAQCKVIISKELPCGHKANIDCHASPASITCEEQCERKLECGHDCVEICGGPCTAQCKVITWKELPCGHKANIECHASPASITCEEQCERKLECGHDCVEICGGPCTAQCKVITWKELPCGHKANIDCHASPASITCEEQCERKLECGHDCVEICGGPCTIECRVQVEKQLPCGLVTNVDCFQHADDDIWLRCALCFERMCLLL